MQRELKAEKKEKLLVPKKNKTFYFKGRQNRRRQLRSVSVRVLWSWLQTIRMLVVHSGNKWMLNCCRQCPHKQKAEISHNELNEVWISSKAFFSAGKELKGELIHGGKTNGQTPTAHPPTERCSHHLQPVALVSVSHRASDPRSSWTLQWLFVLV